MSYMKDVTFEQLSLLSDLVKVYGFKGLSDYETEVSPSNLKRETFQEIAKYLGSIKQLFPTHDVNVARLNGVVNSVTVAMNILRSLLVYCGIPWRTRRKNNTIAMRLVDHDMHLLTLIEAKLMDHTENASVSIQKVMVPVSSWWTNIYKDPAERRYHCCFDVPVQRAGQTYTGLYINNQCPKVLLCGGQQIYGTHQTSLLPESMKWIPYLQYHRYQIVMYDLPELLNEVELVIHYVENNEEPGSGQLPCVTQTLDPDCHLNGKPNFFRYVCGMGGLAYALPPHYKDCPDGQDGYYQCFNTDNFPRNICIRSNDIDLHDRCKFRSITADLDQCTMVTMTPDQDGWYGAPESSEGYMTVKCKVNHPVTYEIKAVGLKK